MRYLCLILMAMGVAFGQSALAPVCPSNVTAGVPFSIPVNLSGTSPAAIQLNVQLPAGSSNISVSTGTAAASANKTAETNPSGGVILVTGLNDNLIGAGVVASINLTIPTAGNVSVQFTFAQESSTMGGSIGVAISSPTCAISVSAPVVTNFCDLNGDGKVDQLDVNIIKGHILGTVAPPPGVILDKNADGRIDVLDAQILIHAAASGVCLAVQ